MADQLDALQASVARLRTLVGPMSAEQIRTPAYPTEWNVADVLSHIGSSAVILLARLEAALAGSELADDLAEPIWAEWNAKTPEAKVADGLAADRAFLDRIASLTDDERARLLIVMGPLQLDLPALIGIRLNEHALHTWDVAVTFDSDAVVPPDVAQYVVDNLGMIVRFTGKPTGAHHEVRLRTSEPTRDFTLVVGVESLALEPADDEQTPDLELPTDALIRLVYGRLDPDHTPSVHGEADLDELRRAFSGV
jgi:uncharacterized protein (TIGR03083 family)